MGSVSRLDAGSMERQITPMPTSHLFRPALFALALGLSCPLLAADTQLGTLQVSAGKLDRRNVAVSFPLPLDRRGPFLFARLSADQLVPVQVDAQGQGWVLLPELAKGATRELAILKRDYATGIPVAVNVDRLGRKLRVKQEGLPILEYQAEPGELPRPDIKESFKRGGYIHPVTTPGGTVVTDDFPPDHIHHHGIWMPWTKTKFEGREPDFWNMGADQGRVEFVQLDHYWSGPVHGGFQVRHKFVDLLAPGGGKTALNEQWTVRVYPAPAGPDRVWIFDFESVQTCATDQPLLLPEYHYGGLGLRGHGDWNGPTKTHWLTSNGETDRLKGHATRANWCYIGGDTAGKRGGVAILGHPDNFRAPQPMRIHPTEPFFCFAPQQLGDMAVEPGKPYVSKYRFLVMDGEPDKERLDALWRDYAEPVQVEVGWKE